MSVSAISMTHPLPSSSSSSSGSATGVGLGALPGAHRHRRDYRSDRLSTRLRVLAERGALDFVPPLSSLSSLPSLARDHSSHGHHQPPPHYHHHQHPQQHQPHHHHHHHLGSHHGSYHRQHPGRASMSRTCGLAHCTSVAKFHGLCAAHYHSAMATIGAMEQQAHQATRHDDDAPPPPPILPPLRLDATKRKTESTGEDGHETPAAQPSQPSQPLPSIGMLQAHRSSTPVTATNSASGSSSLSTSPKLSVLAPPTTSVRRFSDPTIGGGHASAYSTAHLRRQSMDSPYYARYPTHPSTGYSTPTLPHHLPVSPAHSVASSLASLASATTMLMTPTSTPSKQSANGEVLRCRKNGCGNAARRKGLCMEHGGRHFCKMEGCQKCAHRGGYCIAHGGGRRCAIANCPKSAQSGGVCYSHGGGKRCATEGCTHAARSGGFCIKHGRILRYEAQVAAAAVAHNDERLCKI